MALADVLADVIVLADVMMLANVMLMLLVMMMFPRTDVLGPISRVEVAILPLLIARALCCCLHPKPLSHKCAKG